MSLFNKIRGTFEDLFQIGKAGPQIKKNATNIAELRNSDDTDFARLKGAAAQADNEFITLKQLETATKPIIVSTQADTSSSLPNNSGTKQVIVVTTAGSGAVIGDLLYDDGSGSGTVEILPAVEGRTIAVTDALTGGTVTFDPDSIYIWDADGSAWLKIGDIGSVTGAERVISFDIDNTASQASTSSIPANAVIMDTKVKITTPYSVGGTIEVGQTGDTDLLQTTADNDPQSANTYQCADPLDWGGSALPVLVTVGGTPAAGDGTVYVTYTVPNA